MSTEEIVQLVLSAAAGLGLGTLLNSWLTRRWESQKVGSEAIGKIMGQLVGLVGSAKDQIAENETILAGVKRGELSPDRAHERLCEDHIEIGSAVMGARIICEAVGIEAQPLVTALEEFRLSAIEVMRQQKASLRGEPEERDQNAVLTVRLVEMERNLINTASAFMKSIKKAKF